MVQQRTNSVSPEDVVGAFNVAEQVRDRIGLLSTATAPGGGRIWGFAAFFRVYASGKCILAVLGASGFDNLSERLLQGDRAADSEVTAM